MLIGRKEEKKKLIEAFESSYSQFVAVFGRRRVGKTFLVRETFDYHFSFYHTGLSDRNTRDQLYEFAHSLRRHGLRGTAVPQNWFEAFDQLEQLLEQSADLRKVVFIDEMPWMDAPRSKFVPALEHFWNGWASARRDIVLIVCGSATSWIVNKVIKNHGGLHNRITAQIHLQPFSLCECEAYAKALRLGLNRRQLLEGYMVLGGVPYYWSRLDRELSISQNVDRLFFAPGGDFKHEFDDLYASLFHNPEPYIEVVTALGGKKAGMTREELIVQGHFADNGKLTEVLTNLEYCGFIRRFSCIGYQKKNAIYQLIDNYTLFYFHFIKNNRSNDPQYWTKIHRRPIYNSWCGLAFERVCLQHIAQIKQKLGIAGVLANVYSWYVKGTVEKRGAQIDLLIDRDDDVINLCEMKYNQAPFEITALYEQALLNKEQRFIDETRTKKAVRLTLITVAGLVKNPYSADVQNQIVLDDLFVP